jgi:glycosyltransferase involved in cell wall biosynthesis
MSFKNGSDKISVIVPAYNYAQFLPETLSDLQKQTYTNWECIVVDDGSTDDTRNVAKTWVRKDSRFKYIFQKNSGLSAARNTGIEQSQGAFIQLLDADDLLESDKFRLQIKAFSEHPEADIIYGELRYFTTTNKELRWFDLQEKGAPWMAQTFDPDMAKLTATLLRMNIMAVNCPLVRRSVFEDVGHFNKSLKSLEDWEFWCRCVLFGKRFLYLDHPGSYALVRSHGSSMSRNFQRMAEAGLIVREGLKKQIKTIADVQKRTAFQGINDQLLKSTHHTLYAIYKEKNLKAKAVGVLWKNFLATGEWKHFLKTSLQTLS